MTMIMGVDPGLNGALAFVSKDDVFVYDMPTLTYTLKDKKKRRELDVRRLTSLVCKHKVDGCILELLWGMPGMSGTAMFTFGQTYGMTKACLNLTCISYELVTPQKWKKMYGLGRDKSECLAKASELFPGHTDLWPLKKHDGRAEAVLIANYGLAQAGLNLQ